MHCFYLLIILFICVIWICLYGTVLILCVHVCRYKKTFRAYMKYRHILWTRAKVTDKDKEKLEEFEADLEKIRSK